MRQVFCLAANALGSQFGLDVAEANARGNPERPLSCQVTRNELAIAHYLGKHAATLGINLGDAILGNLG